MNDPRTDAEALRMWRASAGLTQGQVAALLERFRGSTVYQSMISSWENGAPMSKTTKGTFTKISNGRIAWPEGSL
jgi:transcriptional regulator with XRE-family HTH domain